MRVAVVDMGTNSTRLLVADVADGAVDEVDRQSTVTRLGRGVDTSGTLAAEAIEDVCRTVGEYVARYKELGAERVTAIATSAVRDATNGDAFIAELRERFSLEARTLSGDEEAQLTFLGACCGRSCNDTLVVDIGGGSTELVVGTGSDVSFHASLQAGVVRHSERHLRTDPPRAADLEELATDVRRLIAAATRDEAGEPVARPRDAIAVAGTPTSLAAIDLGLDPYDPERVHGHRLELPAVQRMLSQLASLPLAERLEVPGLQAGRAPTIVAGVVILAEVMRAFELTEIEVSEHDILYGCALSTALAPA
ncbi:MAG: exopolyphosphatase / guanosine-5-triphosphate,3-diphosphate pyrophosphatase [Solirubrobacterales bacterium]|jgi:exopolyphosphatase/guanosine-5'-triphosphate,3'-diphosphate pyrophosphatase|nr:exopolyphosphatase / guanosine-5-triphosphate,3-diphosphate pyrophosphatase [Solirubrobacterales bacterium]MDX6662633.1 exopolyphosphatase / guanosine-5-triphosphate,3-diphosphate pyrophosphatase [Solirubrobacterales bacterium]